MMPVFMMIFDVHLRIAVLEQPAVEGRMQRATMKEGLPLNQYQDSNYSQRLSFKYPITIAFNLTNRLRSPSFARTSRSGLPRHFFYTET